MNEEKKRIIRYGPPHQYDHAPQGTHCLVIINNVETERYVQISADEENPKWILVEYYEK